MLQKNKIMIINNKNKTREFHFCNYILYLVINVLIEISYFNDRVGVVASY